MPAPAPSTGASAMTASVVRNRAAIDAAFCRAERVTLAASMMPAAIRSSYSPVSAFRPLPDGALCVTRISLPWAPWWIRNITRTYEIASAWILSHRKRSRTTPTMVCAQLYDSGTSR